MLPPYLLLLLILLLIQSCQGLPTQRLGVWMRRALLHLGVRWRPILPGAYLRPVYEGALLCLAYEGALLMGALLRLAYGGA